MYIKAYFHDIKEKILEELQSSEISIKVAVAWFTDKEIFETLREKSCNNVGVQILILDDEINNSSYIDYDELEPKNAKVWKIPFGNKKALMHNKFCIIDDKTIITGSYNWSYKARTNHENITIVKDNSNLISEFNLEFQRIIKFYFPDSDNTTDIDNKNFKKEIISYSSYYQSLLNSEIKLLKLQILGLENEIAKIEKSISDFSIQYDIKLGPLLLELLKLEQIIDKKNGTKHSTAKENFEKFEKSYKKSKNKGWTEINENDSKELKIIFRKATKLCHPDLVNSEEKESAETIFNELKNLNELNDLEGIKKLYNHLKNGVFCEIDENKNFKERKLKTNINRLKIKIDFLEERLQSLALSKTFITIKNIPSSEEYFNYMRLKIENQISEFRIKHEKELTSNI